MARRRDRYVHGTSRREQRRLTVLNDLMNGASLRELALEGGESIADFGCGLGQLTRAMARAAGPGGRVVGIESRPGQMTEARRQARAAGEAGLVDLRRGDARRPPFRPAERGAFDVAHARFLLEHLPDPEAVVRVMVRAVRPGGRIVLEDDDHDLMRLHPEPAGLNRVWEAYVRTYRRNGNDPYVGRRLVALLRAAGAAPRRNTWIFFGACSGHPAFRPLVLNLAEILRQARRAILATRLVDARAFRAALAALRRFGRRDDAAIWYGIAWAEGIRPAPARRAGRTGGAGRPARRGRAARARRS